jgi:hypothetical protein
MRGLTAVHVFKASSVWLLLLAALLLVGSATAQEAAPVNDGTVTAKPGVEGPANTQAKPPQQPPEDKASEKQSSDSASDKPEEKPSDDAENKSSDKPPEKPADPNTREAVCLMIEAAARANDLPLEFFARVIWQESRFQADAIGPMTRRGQRAQGIAQFMPGTASERSLLDPFDPVQALPKSAEFLKELRDQFGNLGLAAAAYNAGPRRVQEWLAGTGSMPQQTRHYVSAITGATVEEWQAAGRGGKISDRAAAHTTCQDLMALLKRAPNYFVSRLEETVQLGAAQPWGVQLGGGFNRDLAMAMYSRAMAKLRSVIGDQTPTLLRVQNRNRGMVPFYQVRIGADTRQAANDLCNRILRAGGACFVLRNIGARG